MVMIEGHHQEDYLEDLLAILEHFQYVFELKIAYLAHYLWSKAVASLAWPPPQPALASSLLCLRETLEQCGYSEQRKETSIQPSIMSSYLHNSTYYFYK